MISRVIEITVHVHQPHPDRNLPNICPQAGIWVDDVPRPHWASDSGMRSSPEDLQSSLRISCLDGWFGRIALKKR